MSPTTPITTIRAERPNDADAVRTVVTEAFGRSDEATLVDELRTGDHVLASLVAERDGKVVGHVLVSRMWIATESGRVPAAALAPLAVAPEHQRQGIGAELVRSGLKVIRETGERIVIVLGEPDYYTRFGFSAALAATLRSPFPPDAYMALELEEGALRNISGDVVYAPPFGL